MEFRQCDIIRNPVSLVDRSDVPSVRQKLGARKIRIACKKNRVGLTGIDPEAVQMVLTDPETKGVHHHRAVGSRRNIQLHQNLDIQGMKLADHRLEFRIRALRIRSIGGLRRKQEIMVCIAPVIHAQRNVGLYDRLRILVGILICLICTTPVER